MDISKNAKWLLTQTMNLGFCRETFPAGSVIVELDDSLMVNGREYKDNRDMEILKRQMLKNPDHPWIIPYSEEEERKLIQNGHTDAVVRKRPPTDHRMPVITSDDDLAAEISMEPQSVSTVSRTSSDKPAKMEVVYDHEGIEDRIRRLEGKGDAESVSARVMMKSAGIQKMPIVRDDSLGAQYDSKHNPALNAGMVFPSKKRESEVVKVNANENLESSERGLVEIIDKVFAPKIEKFADKLQKIDKILELLGKIDVLQGRLDGIQSILDKLQSKLNEVIANHDVAEQVMDCDNAGVGEPMADEGEPMEPDMDVEAEDESVSEAPKRKRGRPRKHPVSQQ